MSHGHDHHGGARGRLGLAFALNVGFTVIELVGAWITNSTAIAADALHDLGDSLSLAFAWGLQGIAARGPDATYSYGFRRLSLLGALVNAAVLLGGGLVVLSETVPRLWDPAEPDAAGMLGLAVLGVVVNGVAVLKVRAGTTLNERVVTWHLLEDVLGWVAVLVVSLVMLFVDLPVLDPLLSILVTAWVGFNALKHLKGTVDLFLQAVPSDVEPEALRARVAELDGVRDLRHVHVWSHDGEHHVLTAQLLIKPAELRPALQLRDLARETLQAAGISHVTLELELDDDADGARCC